MRMVYFDSLFSTKKRGIRGEDGGKLAALIWMKNHLNWIGHHFKTNDITKTKIRANNFNKFDIFRYNMGIPSTMKLKIDCTLQEDSSCSTIMKLSKARFNLFYMKWWTLCNTTLPGVIFYA